MKAWSEMSPLEREAYNAGVEAGMAQRTEERASIIAECREACLDVGRDAHEAAKAKDATDYIAGYQDAAVDCDEALMELLSPQAPRDEHLLECLSGSSNCRKNNPNAVNCCSLYGQYAAPHRQPEEGK